MSIVPRVCSSMTDPRSERRRLDFNPQHWPRPRDPSCHITSTTFYPMSLAWDELVNASFCAFRDRYRSLPWMQTRVRVEARGVLSYPETRSCCPRRDHD